MPNLIADYFAATEAAAIQEIQHAAVSYRGRPKDFQKWMAEVEGRGPNAAAFVEFLRSNAGAAAEWLARDPEWQAMRGRVTATAMRAYYELEARAARARGEDPSRVPPSGKAIWSSQPKVLTSAELSKSLGVNGAGA